jgi:DNA-binding protein HU-beta
LAQQLTGNPLHTKKGGKKMTKAEIVEKIAQAAEITKAKAELAANAFLDGVTEGLKSGDKVTFVGFGTFAVAERKARIGRNPQTGAEIKIPARKAVTFSVGKGLKEAVQEKVKKGKKK